jgi:hypothetical protein
MKCSFLFFILLKFTNAEIDVVAAALKILQKSLKEVQKCRENRVVLIGCSKLFIIVKR